MTQEEYNIFKELRDKFNDACNEYIHNRETFDEDDYDVETDENEWNFIETFDVLDDTVFFVVNTAGYKYEGERYTIDIPVKYILNETIK